MPDNVQIENQPSLSSLVGGIINDAQQLIRQEVLLVRREVQAELNKAKAAAISLGVGMALGVVGGLLLCFMLVHLLYWLTNPQLPHEQLPLWGCFGIIGVLFLIVAAGLAYFAKSQVSKIDVVPRQTVETMKENVQWIKNQT